MDSKITAAKVQAEYQKGKMFKDSLGLFEQVRKNEDFYLGKQWGDISTSKIQPVTINILRRVTSLFQAQVVSDDISWDISPFEASPQSEIENRAINETVQKVYEKQAIKTKNRRVLRNGVVDGDLCMYFSFDPDIETGQRVKGDIVAEPIINTNIFFGNPHTTNVQGQPYIIIARRRPLAAVQAEAKAAGIADWESIQSDTASEVVGEDNGYDQVVELTRLHKVKRTTVDPMTGIESTTTAVHWVRVAGDVITTPETATGMTLYPLAWASWIERNNCMHGISPITEVIPTQIAINKQATYIVAYTQNLAMPRMVYNITRLPNGWTGDPTKAIGVTGDPREAIANPIGGVQMPNGVFSSIEMLKTMMQESMGASDSSLGNISNPDNTSAILATQKASNAPLELQKRMFEQFNEDCIRIIVDMACAYYGQRTINVKYTPEGMSEEIDVKATLDFDQLSVGALDINVEVGAASYWSELVAHANMDKLFQSKIISDPVLYLESIPQGYVPNKQELIESAKKQQEMAAMAAQAQAIPGNPVLR